MCVMCQCVSTDIFGVGRFSSDVWPICCAGEKSLNVGSAMNADASVMGWMLGRKGSAKDSKGKK